MDRKGALETSFSTGDVIFTGFKQRHFQMLLSLSVLPRGAVAHVWFNSADANASK